jgi:hypothetical protein
MKWMWASCFLLFAAFQLPKTTLFVGEQIRQTAPTNAMVWVHVGRKHNPSPIPGVFVADHQLVLGTWNWPKLGATDTLWLCDEEGSRRIALPMAQLEVFSLEEPKQKKPFFRLLRLIDTKPLWTYPHTILEIGNPGKPRPTDRELPQWWAFQPADTLWVAQVQESDSLLPPSAFPPNQYERSRWGLHLIKRKSKWWMVQWWRQTPDGKREWNAIDSNFSSWISKHM